MGTDLACFRSRPAAPERRNRFQPDLLRYTRGGRSANRAVIATRGAIGIFTRDVVPEWDLEDIYGGMMQFMGIRLLGLILISVLPQIALWLPDYLYGGG